MIFTGLKRCHVTAFKIPFINQSTGTPCDQLFKAAKAGLVLAFVSDTKNIGYYGTPNHPPRKRAYIYMREISTLKFG